MAAEAGHLGNPTAHGVGGGSDRVGFAHFAFRLENLEAQRTSLQTGSEPAEPTPAQTQTPEPALAARRGCSFRYDLIR